MKHRNIFAVLLNCPSRTASPQNKTMKRNTVNPPLIVTGRICIILRNNFSYRDWYYLHSLKVPSMYQVFAVDRYLSCCFEAKMMWRQICTFISACSNSCGMCSSSSLKSIVFGSSGRRRWRIGFAALAKWFGFGRPRQCFSLISSKSTWDYKFWLKLVIFHQYLNV